VAVSHQAERWLQPAKRARPERSERARPERSERAHWLRKDKPKIEIPSRNFVKTVSAGGMTVLIVAVKISEKTQFQNKPY
jgi:hypothetical protein